MSAKARLRSSLIGFLSLILPQNAVPESFNALYPHRLILVAAVGQRYGVKSIIKMKRDFSIALQARIWSKDR
jgi:hypothetical protein